MRAASGTLSERTLALFRTSAFELIARVDSDWSNVFLGVDNGEARERLPQDVATLKSEAHGLGLRHIVDLAQRVEALLTVGVRGGATEEVDILLSMSFQFLGMLVRAKTGQAIGIDLPGFLEQVDDLLHDLPPPVATTERVGKQNAGEETPSSTLQSRLAASATAVYLEHLRATGVARERLGDIWRELADQVASIALVPITETLRGHADAAVALARELGRTVSVGVHADGVHLPPDVLDAVGPAVLHVVRNAIDHGIESFDVRRARHKPREGHVAISAALAGEVLVITVADDGGGFDREAVLDRALDLGLASPETLASRTDAEVHELAFTSGLSTSPVLTEASGRGLGLDAARAAVAQVGGTAHVARSDVSGTVVELRARVARPSLDVSVFALPGTEILCAFEGVTEHHLAAADEVEFGLARRLGVAQTREHHEPTSRVAFRIGQKSIVVRLAEEQLFSNVQAERRCPTRGDQAFEVLSFDGRDVLLVRPDVLLGLQATRPSPTARSSVAADNSLGLTCRPPNLRTAVVVDEGGPCRDVTTLRLRELGFQVIALGNLSALPDILLAVTPSLVLVDVDVQGSSGGDVLRTLPQPGCPLVLHSDRSAGEVDALAAAFGAVGTLRKTGNAEAFAAALSTLLEGDLG